MKSSDIDAFFKNLSQEIKRPATIILIGGAAALLLGGVRPTEDIDFSIASKESVDSLSKGISLSEKQSGIRAEYSDDIERWSMFDLLDYKKHTRPYKIFGKLKITILEPEYWSIGKMGRYYDSDVEDMICVFKKQKTNLKQLLTVWTKSLKKSPLSDDLFHFKKHAEHFLKTYGSRIWGRQFTLEKALHRFLVFSK